MTKIPIDFTPIDEETESQILNTLYDILENGGKLPKLDPDISRLLMVAGIREIYKIAKNTRNNVRTLQFGLVSLSIIVFILCTAFLSMHPQVLQIFRP